MAGDFASHAMKKMDTKFGSILIVILKSAVSLNSRGINAVFRDDF